ncbi:MAG: tetratricopeptide repeat protein [Bacteroidota bacterium]
MSLKFSEAQKLIEIEKTIDGSNLIPVYLENYIDFLTLFISEDRTIYNRLKEQKSARINKLEKGCKNSPFYDFCLAGVNLQWALSRLKFGDYTSAAFEIRKAHALLTANEIRYPSFTLNKIGLGVVHVIVGIIPDNYKWVANLMGLDGSLDQGLGEIRQVAEYSGTDNIVSLYRPEALFFLAFLTTNLQENQKEAISLLPKLNIPTNDDHFFKSPLLIFASATILMKNGHNDEALLALNERTELTQRYPFFYLDYLEGIARLGRLDFYGSDCFERFLKNFRGQNYIRSAYQKLAWIAILKGDTLKFNQIMLLVKLNGASIVDEDKQAMNEAVNGILPNIVLLRARLLFDGGYYNRALNELLNNPVKNVIKSKRDMIEYTYRLARVYHESGNLSKAIEYYQVTIQRGKKEPFYFAAGSAFQMGLLYENSGAFTKADSAYRLSLSINTPEYKTSLGEKAKAGLNRVRKKIPKT